MILVINTNHLGLKLGMPEKKGVHDDRDYIGL